MGIGAATNIIEDVAELDPRDAAERLADLVQDETGWLDTFSEQLELRRSSGSLKRVLSAWGLSQSEAARHLGVSRQALSKWLRQGVPAERTKLVADLAAATDLLVHYLKRDRIPAVVRRPIVGLAGRSLIDLLEGGDSQTILDLCREMFRFENAHS